MRERPENFNAAGEDPDATLVAPRFDEADARRAHPVVPLVAAPPPQASYARARRPRRPWTPALLAVALLAVAAVGGAVATKVMQGPSTGQEHVQEQTQSAPPQAAEAPLPVSPPAAEAPREGTSAAKPMTRDARPRRARAAAPAAVDYARDDDDEGEDRRGKKAEKRRGREDEVEKEMRKALKRAKGKTPRLVDVLTSP